MLDWQVGDEDAPDIQIDDPSPCRRWRIPRWLWLGALTILTLAALTGAAYFWLGVREGETRLRTEIQQAADLEIWARQTGNRTVFFDSLDPTAAREWRNRVTRDWRDGAEWRRGAEVVYAEVQDDVAYVELRLTNNEGRLYREGRFYRRGLDGKWRRTSGAAEFWGPSRVTETALFQVQHTQRDAGYVRQAVEGLDPWYRQARADFGLPAPTGSRVIDVVPDPEAAANANLVLRSPLVDLRSDDEAPANSLRAWIAFKLTEELLNEAMTAPVREGRAPALRTLITGLHYWEVAQFAPFTASERAYLTRLLADAAGANRLIPLRELQPWYTDERLPLLWPQQVTAGQFIADTYGRASFARLLRQTGAPLETAVQDAFGVPYDQFEAGWRRYIQDKYLNQGATDIDARRTQ